MLAPNTLLQNRYLVIRHLSRGGMGAVYLVKHQSLGKTFALKETFFSDDDQLRKAFEREAQLLANLDHPALPKVTDHFTEGESQYLVMEYIPGEDLGAQLLASGKPFPIEQVLEWADQLLDALDYLHANDPPIIHRDIKPENLKLTSGGRIILLDFGLAKGAAADMSRMSRSVFGFTPDYAPLEQVHGEGTDARSDLYSLGATLYHLMTGQKPPRVTTRTATIADGHADPLRPANEVNPEVPATVAAILQEAMARNRNQRPANAAAMREALRSTSREANVASHESALLPTVTSQQLGAPAPELIRPQGALEQILAVCIEVLHNQKEYMEAVRIVAEQRGLWWTTVADKCTRRISLDTASFKNLLQNKDDLIAYLIERFPEHESRIRQTLTDRVMSGKARVATQEFALPPTEIIRPAQESAHERQTLSEADAASVPELSSATERAADPRSTPQPSVPTIVSPQAHVFFPNPGLTPFVREPRRGRSKLWIGVGVIVLVIGLVIAASLGLFSSNSNRRQSVTNQVGMEFVYVPAGSFMMGSEKDDTEMPVHQVTIREGFYMGRYEVTQAQWQPVMGNNPAHFKGDNLPVENVSWNDAQEFIRKLNAMNDGYVYRLPTEAEWEYACRAGTTGDYAGDVDAMGWYGSNSGNQTHPVGQKRPNGFGLYDMHGNVWEWCEDWHGAYASGAVTDPTGPSSGSSRVFRGGSWFNTAADLRSANRGTTTPDARAQVVGFRLLRTSK